MSTYELRDSALASIHPKAYTSFRGLADQLAKDFLSGKTDSLFRPFETYRHPARQQHLYGGKTTKARAWQSAHQYGLAVDFVAFRDNNWTWKPTEDWDYLKTAAERVGLTRPLDWDLGHIQHPLWERLKLLVL